MTYHSLIISQTATAARTLAELTEYEAAGVFLRAQCLMQDEEETHVVLNLMRGVEKDVLQERAAQIIRRIIGGIEAWLVKEGETQ